MGTANNLELIKLQSEHTPRMLLREVAMTTHTYKNTKTYSTHMQTNSRGLSEAVSPVLGSKRSSAVEIIT